MNFLTYGEIMLRLSTKNNERFSQANDFEVTFAGSESNVAVDLSGWGKTTAFATSIPDNEFGDKTISNLKSNGVDVRFIKRKANGRLGLIFIEKGANQLGSKVIYDRTDSAFALEHFDELFFNNAFEGQDWFHWTGITPGLGLNSIDNLKRAIKIAINKKMIISCDLNYRSKLWGFGIMPHQIMPELLQNVEIITGNEEDANIMLGLEKAEIDVTKGEINVDAYKSICKKIFENFPKCKVISFSIRESISADHNNWTGLLITRDKTFFTTKYEIKNIVDRVGAGDAFTAGIIYGLSTYGTDYQKVIDFATAASCIKHSIKGDYCLCSVEEISRLMLGNKSGRINR